MAKLRKGFFGSVDVRNVERQLKHAQNGQRRVFGQGGLGFKRQHQHRRGSCLLSRQHQTARQSPRHKTQFGGVLGEVTRAPCRTLGAEQEAQLRIVTAGEVVKLSGFGHLGAHVGEIGLGMHGVGKLLQLDHKLRELNVVERAAAVGHLHAGAQGAVFVTRAGQLPCARLQLQTLDVKRLGANAPCGGRCRLNRLARYGRIQL